MNPIEGPAKRLSVFVDEGDLWRHRPVYAEIVARAREAGLAGATVIRGIEGYGASRHLHTGRFLSLSEDLPLTVIIVDVAERIEAFLPGLDELLVNGGLVIVEDVEVVRYVGRQA